MQRRRKKRPDGVQVFSDIPMYEIVPYIMEERYDSMNMVALDVPIAPMQAYMGEKRKEGQPVSHMALVICAYLRTAAEYPQLNRFIMNRRIYARNEFPVSMVVLKPGSDAQSATMSKLYMELTDTIFDVQRKIDAFIEENRRPGDRNKTDDLIAALLRHPHILGGAIRILKWMDRHNIMPKAVIDASPFHNSLVVTNMASIRMRHIYHHLYEFGTSSVFIAMGSLREVPTRTKEGVEFTRCMPLGCVLDERICSGSYYALCFARMREYLRDPRLLEEAPRVLKRDDVG